MLTKSIIPLFKNQRFIFIVYLLVAIIACLAKVALDFKPHAAGDYISKINNFIIYRNSFLHLINHQNLYGYFPAQQYDEFLYSPTFALLMAPFAAFPLYVGVVFWCAFNATIVYIAIRLLPASHAQKTFMYWFILIELVTALQNVQVNPLIASLFLLTFVAFENKKVGLAALCIVLSMYIKVFGIVGASLFLIYPERLKFIAYAILWAIVLFALPLVVVSANELLTLYQNWFHSLAADHTKNIEDVSAMRLLSGLSGITFSEHTRLWIQIVAVFVFCVKYIRTAAFSNPAFRFLFLASAMIWCILFNHAAESSTYIIAIAGVAIWYNNVAFSKINMALLILAFIMCSLSPTDIFPRFIRVHYIVPLALKALPCLLIYFKLEYDLIIFKNIKPDNYTQSESPNATY